MGMKMGMKMGIKMGMKMGMKMGRKMEMEQIGSDRDAPCRIGIELQSDDAPPLLAPLTQSYIS
jgi:hypothetical protein